MPDQSITTAPRSSYVAVRTAVRGPGSDLAASLDAQLGQRACERGVDGPVRLGLFQDPDLLFGAQILAHPVVELQVARSCFG
jgi:hypothetical protein